MAQRRQTRVITVTLNPCFDHSFAVDNLRPGSLNRAVDAGRQAAGKGINVARMLTELGTDVAAALVLPDGGSTEFISLHAQSAPLVVLGAPGQVRTNITIQAPEGTTKINTPGPPCTDEVLDSVLHYLKTQGGLTGWIVISGSSPPETRPSYLSEIVSVARSNGCRIAADVDGTNLAVAVRAGADLVKPNREELAAATDRRIDSLGDAIHACRSLIDQGAGAVLASLGADGLLYVDPDHRISATAPSIEVVSDVGAGDACLGGFLSQPEDLESALRYGTACGRAACLLSGTSTPSRSDLELDDVTISHEPEHSTPLARSS